MNEWHSTGKQNDERQHNLDERLAAYYGPELREQPLPSSSWLRLRSRLGVRHTPQSWFVRRPRFPRFSRYRKSNSAPTFVQTAFAHIVYEARVSHALPKLHYSIKTHARIPLVHVSLLGRRNIRLTLPSAIEHSIEPAELDVLLATGLSCYLCMRKPVYILRRLLLYSAMALVCVTLALLWLHGLPFNILLIAIALWMILCTAVTWLLHKQRRAIAFQADTLMVQWLGRGRACQGLHALAGRSQHIRARSQKRWGEVSLVERINRVCGTQVPVEHERLTLVR